MMVSALRRSSSLTATLVGFIPPSAYPARRAGERARRVRDTDKHFHTLEIVVVASLGVPVLWHLYRAIAGKMTQTSIPAVQKLGAAGAGIFTFGVNA